METATAQLIQDAVKSNEAYRGICPCCGIEKVGTDAMQRRMSETVSVAICSQCFVEDLIRGTRDDPAVPLDRWAIVRYPLGIRAR